MLKDKTRRHHYISQAEQRFNALNKAESKKKQRIYKFEVITRDPPTVRLSDEDGVLIKSNLAYRDLFTIENGEEIVKNFEALFHCYETKIRDAVDNLQQKLENRDSDFSNVLFDIWVLKFLNIWRNPYGAKKFLNSFPQITDYEPNDPYYKSCYEQIEALTEEEVADVLDEFDLALDDYKGWLKGLLLLLMPPPAYDEVGAEQQENMFEQVALQLLTDTSQFRLVEFHFLTEDFPGRFLLSDRSYFYDTEPTANELRLHFNITDRIYMKYWIVDPAIILKEMKEQDPKLAHASQELIEESQAEIAQEVQVRGPIWNDEDHVRGYNEMVIYQAKQHVFCSQREVMGATVEPAQ